MRSVSDKLCCPDCKQHDLSQPYTLIELDDIPNTNGIPINFHTCKWFGCCRCHYHCGSGTATACFSRSPSGFSISPSGSSVSSSGSSTSCWCPRQFADSNQNQHEHGWKRGACNGCDIQPRPGSV